MGSHGGGGGVTRAAATETAASVRIASDHFWSFKAELHDSLAERL